MKLARNVRDQAFLLIVDITRIAELELRNVEVAIQKEEAILEEGREYE